MSTTTQTPHVGTDPRARELPQYSLRQILVVWAAATIPMSVFGWIVAPWLSGKAQRARPRQGRGTERRTNKGESGKADCARRSGKRLHATGPGHKPTPRQALVVGVAVPSRGGGTLAEYPTRQSVYFAFLVLGVVLGHHGDPVAGR
jgi:hypothetical protein